jgi:Holliday junction resolvasome RuvABC DNA-binding subunit
MIESETQTLLALGYTAEGISEVERVMRENGVSALVAHELISAAPAYDAERDKHIPGIGPYLPEFARRC